MPPFKEYEIKWIAEDSTRLAGLLAGELHAIALSRDLQETALEAGMKVIPAQQPFTQLSVFFGGMYFIPGDPDFDPTTPWTDKRVRQAMNMALNRDELNQPVFPRSA
jgi:ABC-type transport system substrate-binding protein